MNPETPVTIPWVVVVGGFLGAGKTTLLLVAAELLKERGLRAALVLNDQGDALVDSAQVAMNGFDRGEVTGGCFCCRFSELVEVMDELRSFSPDVIFAEPVGSCTDISATTLQPLREYSANYRLAPFTVLVDPSRASRAIESTSNDHLRFLFTKQLKEADIICVTKSDIYPIYPDLAEFTQAPVRQISAKNGQGVKAWLDEVLSGSMTPGGQILDIDYERYAQAEAALAWLNLETDILAESPISPSLMLGPLLERLDADLTSAGIAIVHLKAIVSSSAGYIKAAICDNGQEPVVEGNLIAPSVLKHHLLLNLRAVGSAQQVRQIVDTNVNKLHAHLSNLEIVCFHPAAPNPERRYSVRAV